MIGVKQKTPPKMGRKDNVLQTLTTSGHCWKSKAI
jgi:hypothetical protein